MLILSLDTTTRAGSVAVVRDDGVLAVREGDPARTHAERLPGEIEDALAAAGVSLRALDLLVVATGPGAFTGLRIGLAAVQGVALALERPVVGVSSLDALACTQMAFDGSRLGPAPTGRLVASWLDAARGEVYAALYVASEHGDNGLPWRMLQPPTVASPGRVLDAWTVVSASDATVVGDGAVRYAEIIAAREPGWRIAPPAPPLAPALAWIGRRLAERGQAGPPHALQPLYVRRPDAEMARHDESRA
jgi:tRNA threonylcarbamoyladenosine biosynthesis protein TsaB